VRRRTQWAGIADVPAVPFLLPRSSAYRLPGDGYVRYRTDGLHGTVQNTARWIPLVTVRIALPRS